MKQGIIALGLTLVSALALMAFALWIGEPIPTGSWTDWLRIALILFLVVVWGVTVKPVTNGIGRWASGE